LDELLEQSPKLERDLYWTPCTLDSLQNPEPVNKPTEIVISPEVEVNKVEEPVVSAVAPIETTEQKPFVFAKNRETIEPTFEFSREEAEEFIRVHFKDSVGKTIPELKDTHGLTQQ